MINRPRAAAWVWVVAAGCTAPPWAVENPARFGLDEAELEQAFELAEEYTFMHSLLVAREGALVGEAYFRGYGSEVPHTVMSVTKSVTSAAVGIAVDQGLVELDEEVAPWFPEYDATIEDPRVRQVTVEHLLHMRGGFPDDHDSFWELYGSDDWIGATLAQTLVGDPGESWSYSTFSTHLLSGVLTRAAGVSLPEYTSEHLCYPAEMYCWSWALDPQGVAFGGSEQMLTPVDMVRFGELFRASGKVKRRQVVPSSWVEASLQPQAGGDWTWGEFEDLGYGRLWWTGRLADHQVFFALGHGGQYVLVAPEAELVVATTAYWQIGWEDADYQERLVGELIARHVLGALED